MDHLLRTCVKPSAIRTEEQDEIITDIPDSDQPSTETETPGLSNSENDNAPVENESATASTTTSTTFRCSSRIRQPTIDNW